MDTKILLGKLLQRFRDKGFIQQKGYYRFEYVRETNNAVYVLREKGTIACVSFQKLCTAIDAYKSDKTLYESGPVKLRAVGITHVTSPVWSILHLLKKEEYQ